MASSVTAINSVTAFGLDSAEYPVLQDEAGNQFLDSYLLDVLTVHLEIPDGAVLSDDHFIV